jgi:hypothetical protein
MRLAEAKFTLGVVHARQGDLEGAAQQGVKALSGDRKSMPSLLMVSRDLTKVLHDRYANESEAQDYFEHLDTLTSVSSAAPQSS